MQTQFNINDLLFLLELPMDSLDKFQTVKSIPAAQKTLNAFKKVIKQQRKNLSKKYHPDRGGNEERMKEINNICDWILGSEIMAIRRPQPIYQTFYSYGGSSTTTSNSTGAVYHTYVYC